MFGVIMAAKVPDFHIAAIRDASRRLVRELGFMKSTLAGTDLPPSAVHALLAIGASGALTSVELSKVLALEKSSISRMVRKLIEAGELVEKTSHQDGRVKPLSLTKKGRSTLAAINKFAQNQVVSALNHLSPAARRTVRDGLASYAGALEASRTGRSGQSPRGFVIESGYRSGVIGRTVEMHAHYYGQAVGFGRFFETQVAAGLADFASRLGNSRNELWVALHSGDVVGTVAIDGEDLGAGVAHLRWFIVDDSLRGQGIGRALLAEAVGFCDRQGFAETQLWTFQGLDAARRLYEGHGFSLAEEKPGRQWGSEVIEQRFVRPCSLRDLSREAPLQMVRG
ncbi:MAG: MarR family transcriptional regulator [Tardiphaga sp.]|nr:MarR family transcriptional regulator [Tardiphaga sp.]